MTVAGDDEAVVQRALQDSELHKGLLDQLEEGVYIVDRERRILYWNAGAERISGYLAHEVTGQFCYGDLMMHCDTEGTILCGHACPLSETMTDGRARECTVFLRHRQGHRLPVRVHARPIHDSQGAIIGALEMFEEALASAHHSIWPLRAFGCIDALTTAASREYGEMRVRQSLEALSMFGIPFGWLRAGLDQHERIEHSYGQGMIDAALKMIAGTLGGSLGALDLLTLWNRTEFRIEVHYSSRLELADAAEELVTLVRASNLQWWGDRVRVTACIAGTRAEPCDTLESLETRVGEVFESCQAGGGDRAAIAHGAIPGAKPCLP